MRAVAIQKVMTKVSKLFVSRQVRDALKFQNELDSTDTYTARNCAPFLVYRPKEDHLKRPFSVVEINRIAVIVRTVKGAKK